MRAIYARRPKEKEPEELLTGLKASEGILVRRCQIILMSAEQKMKAGQIGERLGMSDQYVRQIIHRFNAKGIAGLKVGNRARQGDQRALNDEASKRLQEILHQSPRIYGYESSLWTLKLLAEECYKQGLTSRQVYPGTIYQTLSRLNIGWKRAKHWINSPDEGYERKKSDGTG